MGLNRELVGKVYDGGVYEVTAEAIAAYAHATNDANARYLGADSVASPVFPVVPAFASFMAAARDPGLGADLLRLVHIAEEHVLERPLRPGDAVSVSTVLTSVGADEGGESFSLEASLSLDDGAVAAVVRATMLVRGAPDRSRRRRPRPPGPPSEIVHERGLTIDEDQPVRYAHASGDLNPIHLDEAAARAAKLPGVVLHGMCTMAMASSGVVDSLAAGEPERIRAVAARFAKPVFPGQELVARYWRLPDGNSGQGYGFDVVNRAGVALLQEGRAVVSVE